MRIFLSFHSRDIALAEAIQAGLSRIEPGAEVFFSPVSLGAGFWLPRLAEEIAGTDAFLLLVGPNGVGAWQEVEYFDALDRHVKHKQSFPLVPVIRPSLIALAWSRSLAAFSNSIDSAAPSISSSSIFTSSSRSKTSSALATCAMPV